MLDVSSFFYSINLPLLHQQIRHSVSTSYAPTIDILLAFLSFSDRSRLGYLPSSHGIPVEELGDSSRVLAQIYLQQYDERILDHCQSLGPDFGYIRFSDDQILFAPNIDSAHRLLFKASEFLYQIGLQVNTSKVQLFDNMDDFDYYWSFDIVESGQYRQEFDFNSMVAAYLDRFGSGGQRNWRDDRLRHLIIEHASSESVSADLLGAFVDHCLQTYRILQLDHRKMQKLFRLGNAHQQSMMLEQLRRCSESAVFNGFQLNLLKFCETEVAKAAGFVAPCSALRACEDAYTS